MSSEFLLLFHGAGGFRFRIRVKVEQLIKSHVETIIRWHSGKDRSNPFGLLPVSMIVGQVLMLTEAAASLERRILMRFCVVRIHAALLTWQQNTSVIT